MLSVCSKKKEKYEICWCQLANRWFLNPRGSLLPSPQEKHKTTARGSCAFSSTRCFCQHILLFPPLKTWGEMHKVLISTMSSDLSSFSQVIWLTAHSAERAQVTWQIAGVRILGKVCCGHMKKNSNTTHKNKNYEKFASADVSWQIIDDKILREVYCVLWKWGKIRHTSLFFG